METRHKGLHRYRFGDNPLEKKFADEWQRRNGGRGVLDYLLAKDNNRPAGEVSDRDAEVAATVIQWLGSHVGRCFLDDVLGTKLVDKHG
jgi:hypothetical protein